MLQIEDKRVDLRIRRTKKMLQDAFMALMAEKPFADISVQDITERAMVNRGTFYDHFADKYALAEHALREMFRHTLSRRLPADFAFTPDNLGLLILATCEFMSELYSHCLPSERNEFPANLQMQITAVVQEILNGWFRAAHPASRRDAADLAASVTSWAIFGAALHWSQSDRSEPADTFVPRVLPIILAGVSPAQ
jgi:AcrR family transcriptional regulator